MKYDFTDCLHDCLYDLSDYLRHPSITVYMQSSFDVAELLLRLQAMTAALDDLKKKYESLGRSYARECQVNIQLQDQLKEMRSKK